MAYIGNFPAEKYTTFSKQTFTPDGSTTSFTLDFSVANENDLELFINNVRQEPGSGKSYTATGLTLTMSSAPGASDSMYAIFQGKAQQTVTPGSQTVTGSMLATDIVISTTGTISSGAITTTGITSSGSITASQYYRAGDADTYFGFPADNQLQLVGGASEIVRAYQIAGAYGILRVNGSGSSTYPNFTFNGDDNTGMYRATTDTLAFTTSGSERMRIDSNGDVSINTTSPQAKLHIVRNDAGALNDANSNMIMIENTTATGMSIGSSTTGEGHIYFSDSADADVGAMSYFHVDDSLRFRVNASERIRIDSSGNVGIGETSPLAKLHVKLGDSGLSSLNAAGNHIFLENSGGSGTGITLASGNTSNGSIIFGDQDSNYRGVLIYDHSADAMKFVTAGTEKMRILSGGNVGIGTSSPDANLEVLGGGTSGTTTISASNGIVNSGNYHDLTVAGNNTEYAVGIRRTLTASTPAYLNPRMDFFVQNNDTYLPADRGVKMTLLNNGRLGIGTTSPSTTLDVNGTITATSFSGGNLGKVLQVFQGQNATQISTTTHNVNFDITSVTITPSSTSSKILLLGVIMGIQSNNNSANTRFDAKIFRGTTALNSSGANFWTFNTDYWREGGFAIHWLDSPSTTSATTYYLKGAWLDPNGGTVYVNKDGNSGYSTLTVMEIAG